MNNLNNNLPEGFKITEFGPIPKEWGVAKLGDILHLIRNGLTKTQDKDGKGIPVTRIETIAEERIDINRVGYLQDLNDMEFERYKLNDKDILFSHINSEPMLGKTAIYEGDPPVIIHGMNLLLMRVNQEKCHPDYLNDLFKIYRAKGIFVGLASRAVGQASINQGKLRSLDIILPPLPEQKAIARVLSTIQRAIEAQDKIIAAARELKKSLMRHLFTYGPVPVAEAENVPLKETEIGPVPEHWNVVKLGTLGEIITGTTPSTKVAEYYGDSHMFITPGDIYQTKYVTKTSKYLSDKGLKVSRPLPCDTVLVVCIGATIGKTAMTSVDNSVTNQQINSIITNQRIEPHYCFYAVIYYSDLLPALAGRVAIPIVNKSNFSKFLIPLPHISEQHEIARMLSGVDNKIEAEENRKSALQALFKTMLHQLMTGKVRVKDLEATEA